MTSYMWRRYLITQALRTTFEFLPSKIAKIRISTAFMFTLSQKNLPFLTTTTTLKISLWAIPIKIFTAINKNFGCLYLLDIFIKSKEGFRLTLKSWFICFSCSKNWCKEVTSQTMLFAEKMNVINILCSL